MPLNTILTTVAVAVGIVALVFTVAGYRLNRGKARLADQRTRFAAVVNHMRANGPRLEGLALDRARSRGWVAHPVPLLTKPGWILDEPVPLESVELAWSDESYDGRWQATRDRLSRVLPYEPELSRHVTFSEAIAAMGNMSFFDGRIFRPVEVDVVDAKVRLTCTQGTYFGYLDTGEVVSYHAAARDSEGEKDPVADLGPRAAVDPFDLRSRVASIGVLTLTIRRSAHGSTFFLHQRDPKRVIVGPTVIHVVPAGEFTPADITISALRRDFSLWHNIMRECAEEFLGRPDALGQGGRQIDYDAEFPYDALNRGRSAGAIRCHVLGLGLDPLTWKPELLTVCVYDADVFDEIYREMVDVNDEGTILKDLPFTEDTVYDYAARATELERTRGATRACLTLAWQHRERLGLA